MRPIACFICLNADEKKFAVSERYYQFDLLTCAACGAEFWWPMDNKSYMPKTHWLVDDSICNVFEERHQKGLEVVRRIAKPSMKLLDIGCRGGGFLKHVSELGLEIWGIDPEGEIITVAKRVYGLPNLYPLNLYEFSEKQKLHGYFDFISIFEIFEHMDDPRRFLEVARSLLAPGGRIIMSVPNFLRFGGYPKTNHAPIQWTRWTERIAKLFLENNGFMIEKIAFVEPSLRQLCDFAQSIFRKSSLIPPPPTHVQELILRYDPQAAFYFRAVLRFLCAPLFATLKWSKRSSTILLVGKLRK